MAPAPLLALLLLLLPGCHVEGDAPEPGPDLNPAATGRLAGDPEGPDPSPSEPYDLLLFGGILVDGTGAPGRKNDVLVRDGRIVYLGIVDPDTLEVGEHFDARGLVITPGFIDIHAHGDPLETPRFPNFLAMGVTTIVLGQDGGSPQVADLPSLMEDVERVRPWVNVAWLVGHNTLRGESGVGFGHPDAVALTRMAALVERGLEAGAFGLSLGLEYEPGSRADMAELVAISRPVAARNGVVMSHMRNEDADRVEASLSELLEQGRRSGARVHASHLKVVLGRDPGQARRMLNVMAQARSEGVEATGDVYPYTASFTGLAILFPEWARPPHDYDAIVRVRRNDLAAHLRDRVESRNGPQATLFGTGPWAGRTLAEVAREEGRPFEEILMELGPGGARAAYFVMDDEVMATFLDDPHTVVASDGSPGMSHPRGYGTYARILRRFVREEGRLTLEAAVRKMTGLAAAIVGLDDPERVNLPRGLVQEGWAADLLAFDPAEVRDRADFQNPHRLSEGMRGVWVNGAPAWREGAPGQGPGNGSVLRDGSGTGNVDGPVQGTRSYR